MADALVLLSGGLDSAVCAHLLLARGLGVSGLFVDYGQAAVRREREASAAVARSLDISLRAVAIAPTRPRGAGEIPGRNAMLISLAAFELGSRGGLVTIGVHAGTSYYDCSIAFVDAMGRLVSEQTNGKTTLLAPLATWSKAQVFRTFRDAGLPVHATYSCESGDEPCGACRSCRDRLALAC